MKKKPRKSAYKTVVSEKIPGRPVSYHPQEHPMARLTKELPKKKQVSPLRKGTRKSSGAK